MWDRVGLQVQGAGAAGCDGNGYRVRFPFGDGAACEGGLSVTCGWEQEGLHSWLLTSWSGFTF